MKLNLKRIVMAVALAGLPLAGLSAAETQPPMTAALENGTDWVVRWHGKPVCVYHFAPGLKKPYVRELYTLRGENILRDAPADHLHHHALMYGIRVNGRNFWEEAEQSGVQKPVRDPGTRLATTRDGRSQAMFTQRLEWQASPSDPRVLLVEDRAIGVAVNEDLGEVALVWRSRFEVGPGIDEVTLEGANYHGLGLRFLEELDRVAVHWVEGETLNLENNRQDVRPGRWAAVTFDAPGKPATVAVAGHPGNRGAPSHFFSMRTPFAYLSATQNLDREPLKYAAGDRWVLVHRVLLYPEVKTPGFIEGRVAAWIESGAGGRRPRTP